MRLDKYIANNSEYSRSDAKKLIRSKLVSVFDEISTNPAQDVTENAQVTVRGTLITAYAPLFLMLNKPQGYLCANKDSMHPVVLDLLQNENNHGIEPSRRHELQIAGRLDIDTTGLVLLTTDGDWNHRITSPRKDCFKRYRVTLKSPITTEAIKQLEEGVLLHGESKITMPAKIDVIAEKDVRLYIQEGKFHQVKRMFLKVGNEVIKLHREAIGHIELDPNLPEGQWRPLTRTETEGF